MDSSLSEKAQALVDQAERLRERAASLEEQAVWIEQLPVDDFEDGAVIWFTKRFPYRNTRRKYSYAAIKFDGQWCTTGPNSPKYLSWDELLTFLSDGVDEVWHAIEWERIL